MKDLMERFQHQQHNKRSSSHLLHPPPHSHGGGGGSGRKDFQHQTSSSSSSSSIKFKDAAAAASNHLNLRTGRAPPPPPPFQGNAQFRKRVDALEVVSDTSSCSSDLTEEEDSFAFEFRQRSSKQASGTLMKKLLADEMSREMESRRRPPSVIARLMGLDALPPQQPIHKQEKKFSENYLRRTASIGFVEKSKSYEGRSSRMSSSSSNKEPQEFKDVFEVFETSQAGKHSNNLSVPKETINRRASETKMEFVRQKFMDVKRLSTDEKLQQSKEFHDALEVLDSNKDLLLKFLQEPDSLFTKHLQDLQGVQPPPRPSHITVLKSSNAHNYENSDLRWKLERGSLKDVRDSCHKPEHGVSSHRHNKQNVHTSSKGARSQLDRKSETSLAPTRIVVLKPNVVKEQTMARSVTFPNSTEGLPSDHGRHREHQSYENRELFAEVRDRRISSSDVKLLKQRAQGSREIAKEITRQMRQSARGARGSSIKVPNSGFRGYTEDESSYTLSGNDSPYEPEVMTPASRHFSDWKSRYSPSTSYSTESSVSKEAKKRISERWKMTHGSQKGGSASSGNTLGEMLALPDSETGVAKSDCMAGQDGITDRLTSHNGIAKWDSPLGISSRDGWKDECARSLPRSRSLPASSAGFGSPKRIISDGAFGSERCSVLRGTANWGPNKSRKEDSNHRECFFYKSNMKSNNKKSRPFLRVGGENKLILQETHPEPEESREMLEEKDCIKEKPVLASQDYDQDNTERVIDEISVSVPEDAEISSGTSVRNVTEPTPLITSVEDRNTSAHDPDSSIPEQPSPIPPEEISCTSQSPEPESPGSSKEAEQPSPVSVLEPPFEDEISPDDPDCFQSVSADLQGLRMQLQLLKLESSDTYSDCGMEMMISSDDECGEGYPVFANKKGEMMRMLSGEESRDFSYIVDVLTDFLDMDQDMLLTRWYSPECPVGPPMFENLEKKYEAQITWPRSERRLLFDRANSGLAGILHQHMDLHPWVKKSETRIRGVWRKEPLEEELWKLLLREVKEGKEETLENVLGKEISKWMDLGDEIDVVGREIERSLMDELVVELVMSM